MINLFIIITCYKGLTVSIFGKDWCWWWYLMENVTQLMKKGGYYLVSFLYSKDLFDPPPWKFIFFTAISLSLFIERKLNRLTKIRKNTGKEILERIEETRKDCMIRLLSEEFERRPEDLCEESIPTKWLKSHINPQQALTVQELVQLVEADYLAKATEELDQTNNGGTTIFEWYL